MMRDNDQIKSLNKRIHEILLQEWDPIGIQDFLDAHDEYDSYISNICRLLSFENSQIEIFKYLWWIETVHMELPGDKLKTEIISKKIDMLKLKK